MRVLQFGLVGVAIVMTQAEGATGQDAVAAAPHVHLRSQRNQAVLGPFHFADGDRIRLGNEDYTVELLKRPGKLIYKGKTRFFRTVTGLLPISSQKRFVGSFADELILEYGSARELAIPWDKIARIEITENQQPGNYYHSCKVTTPDGKAEAFDRLTGCYVEFDWTDSIARERCSLLSMIGVVIEFGVIPTTAERE